jgi:glycosyltransferase involved in cell wall biosynthesis
MKVLLVHNSYQQPGGEDVVFQQECQLLESFGHEVLKYCRTNNEIEHASTFARLGLVKTIVWAADTRRDFARLLHKEQPDVVHIHNTFLMISPSIYAACREAQVPVVQTLHNYRLFCPAATFFRDGQVCEECVEHSLWRGIRHGCYRDSRAETAAVALMLAAHRWRHTWTELVDCYVALTDFARRKFIAAGLPAEKISVKPNFVHPDPGVRVENGEYALYVGRLSPEKGLHTLLKAWRLVDPRIPLMVVGDGPLRPALEEEATKAGLANISFRGRLARADVIAAMRGARFLVFPSECYENFPAAIAEAFACGVPVIASDLGAMPEIVDRQLTGLLFRPGDAADLAQACASAWSDVSGLQRMGKNARAEYEAKYAAQENCRMLLAIYERAIARCVAVPKKAVLESSSAEFVSLQPSLEVLNKPRHEK